MRVMNNSLNLFVFWCQNRKDFIDKSHHVKNMSEVRLQSLCDYFGGSLSAISSSEHVSAKVSLGEMQLVPLC